ncbi:hypothetical protein NQZ68_039699, partial [Dissostichus eleginoides]
MECTAVCLGVALTRLGSTPRLQVELPVFWSLRRAYGSAFRGAAGGFLTHIAVYISERKVKTAAEAAALADDYVLTHRGGRDFRVQDEGEENAKCFPRVFVACAVTRAVSRAQEESEQGEEVGEIDYVVVPDSLLSVSRSELVIEQKADISLSPFFEAVLSTEDGNGATVVVCCKGSCWSEKRLHCA